MSVITTTKRTFQGFLVLAAVAAVGMYMVTKLDTSKDRQATVLVKLNAHGGRALGIANTYINGAERSADQIDEKSPTFTETFWVRPGEKVGLSVRLIIGSGSLACQISLDGQVVAGPQVTPRDFESSCDLSAVA